MLLAKTDAESKKLIDVVAPRFLDGLVPGVRLELTKMTLGVVPPTVVSIRSASFEKTEFHMDIEVLENPLLLLGDTLGIHYLPGAITGAVAFTALRPSRCGLQALSFSTRDYQRGLQRAPSPPVLALDSRTPLYCGANLLLQDALCVDVHLDLL